MKFLQIFLEEPFVPSISCRYSKEIFKSPIQYFEKIQLEKIGKNFALIIVKGFLALWEAN